MKLCLSWSGLNLNIHVNKKKKKEEELDPYKLNPSNDFLN